MAQWLEHSVHIRGVAGSNPAEPTVYEEDLLLLDEHALEKTRAHEHDEADADDQPQATKVFGDEVALDDGRLLERRGWGAHRAG